MLRYSLDYNIHRLYSLVYTVVDIFMSVYTYIYKALLLWIDCKLLQ